MRQARAIIGSLRCLLGCFFFCVDSCLFCVRIGIFVCRINLRGFVKTTVKQREGGDYSVLLSLNDEVSDLLKMELMAPTQKHAYRLANAFSERAESIYRSIMDQLLAEPKEDT